MALTREELRLAVFYRPDAPSVRLSAFSQVAFFAIGDYALPGCRAPQPMVVIPSEERAQQPTTSGAQHFVSMASASLGGRLAPGHR